MNSVPNELDKEDMSHPEPLNELSPTKAHHAFLVDTEGLNGIQPSSTFQNASTAAALHNLTALPIIPPKPAASPVPRYDDEGIRGKLASHNLEQFWLAQKQHRYRTALPFQAPTTPLTSPAQASSILLPQAPVDKRSERNKATNVSNHTTRERPTTQSGADQYFCNVPIHYFAPDLYHTCAPQG